MNETEHILERMMVLARECGERMKNAETLNVEKKKKNDYVTDMDKGIQETLISSLKETVDSAFFIAEEKENAELTDGEGFIIDPIDGTNNFINGFPVCAVCIAYVKDKEIQCSVVYNPYMDEMFHAIKGNGSYLNGRRLHMERRDLESSLILVEDSWNAHKEVIYSHAVGYRCIGSGELAICFTACGRAAGFISKPIHIWDYAAGKLILNEAGGVLVQKDGKDAELIEPNSVIACHKEDRELFLAIRQEAERN